MKLSLFIKRESLKEPIKSFEINDTSSTKEVLIKDYYFFESDSVAFTIDDENDNVWKYGYADKKPTKKSIIYSSGISPFNQLAQGENIGNTYFNIYKNNTPVIKIHIYIFPTKILHEHFDQMVKDIYKLFPNIVNEGIINHKTLMKILNRENQTNHRIVFLKELIGKFIHFVQKIMRSPNIKSKINFKPNVANHRINKQIIKTISKRGYKLTLTNDKNLNNNLLPINTLKPDMKSIKNIFHCILYFRNKIEEVNAIMAVKKIKKVLEKVIIHIINIQNLYMQVFQIPNNVQKVYKLPPISWGESQNKNYLSIRKIIYEFEHTLTIPIISKIGDKRLAKISDLYEYWLFLKIYNAMESIKGSNNTHYMYETKKPEIKGSINGFQFNIVKEREIPLAGYNKIGQINNDKNLIKGKTPDYSFYLKKDTDILINKIFIFDAKYMPESSIYSQIIECELDKNYNRIGYFKDEKLNKRINLVNHFWIFYPGFNNNENFNNFESIYKKAWDFKNDLVYTSGWLPLRPEYNEEYNADHILKSFLTKIFKIEGIIK